MHTQSASMYCHYLNLMHDDQMIEVRATVRAGMRLSLGILSRFCTASTAYIEMSTILCLVTVPLEYYELQCADSP